MRIVPVPTFEDDGASDAPTKTEVQRLREIMRSDAPPFDEPPELPGHLYDHEAMAPLPDLSDDRGGFFGWGDPECGAS